MAGGRAKNGKVKIRPGGMCEVWRKREGILLMCVREGGGVGVGGPTDKSLSLSLQVLLSMSMLFTLFLMDSVHGKVSPVIEVAL